MEILVKIEGLLECFNRILCEAEDCAFVNGEVKEVNSGSGVLVCVNQRLG